MISPASNITTAYAWIATLPRGARKWFARAWLLHLITGGKAKPEMGNLSPRNIAEVKAKLKEILGRAK